MRIAVVAESVFVRKGGAETSTAQFVTHLVRAGMRVELYTRSEVPSSHHLRVHTVDVHRPRSLQTLAFSRQADRMLESASCDLVHAITPCMRANVYQPRGGTVPETVARNLALQPGSVSRSLKRFSNYFNVKQQSMLRLEAALLRRTPPPLVVAISDYVAEQLTRHYGYDTRCVKRVYNGVDFEPPSEHRRIRDRQEIRALYGVAADTPMVLMVAHNLRLKGLDAWLRAMCMLRQRGRAHMKSVIVGHGRVLPYFRKALAMGLADSVVFAGPTRNVGAFYNAADVLVHPTFYDPCSRVVLEALLYGLPCVTTRHNGAAEAIQDGATGRIVDTADNAVALAEATIQALNPTYRTALREEHERLCARLSMSRHARELVALYESICGARTAVQPVAAPAEG